MKILLVVILGIMIGLTAARFSMSDYQTSNESDVRLYDNVVAR